MTDPATIRPKNIGARIKRVEDPRLLTGQGSFAADRIAPGALHVGFRRSDRAHARIAGINTAAAAQLPGVARVYTAADLDGLVEPLRATSRMRNYHPTPIYPLACGKVRYVGEPVVAVLAESRYVAEDALDLIEIVYEPLPTVIDPELAAQADAPLLHDEAGTNTLVEREFSRGDVDAELARAPIRVGGRFRFRRKAPLALENRACIAEYDRGRRTLTLTSSTQVPGVVRDVLADLLQMPGHSMDVGGGFGGKASVYPEEILVAVLARRLGRSVRWTGDRLEDLASTTQGFDEIADAELGLDNDGRILALSAEVIGDVGAYSIYPWTAALEPVQVVSFLPGPYRVPAYRGHVRAVATNKTPMGPYRGVGRPVSTFVMERLIDMAARRLAIDPIELRRSNLVRTDEFPYRVASGIVWDRSGFIECLDTGTSERARRRRVLAKPVAWWGSASPAMPN
jgi:carbon-monoxide dehydrogenase large subunit